MIAPSASPRLTQQTSFVRFWLARLASSMGVQMLTLVIAWRVYQITNSALDLGLIGLIQFVPAVAFTLLVGHIADRYDRRLIVRGAQSLNAIAALIVTAALFEHMESRDLLFAAALLVGSARAFESPSAAALVPSLVPAPMVPRAIGAWTSANQTAVICGPALGGLIYAASPVAVGTLCVAFFSAAVTLVGLVRATAPAATRDPPSFASLLAGFHYIRTTRRLLGVISLDLFVVLFGSAIALLPIYARDILMVGPIGLGLLRSAPAVGALLTAITLANHPIERHVGPKMFAAVALFGLATIVFALSDNFLLSLAALAVLGAADAVSIVIRVSLVQIETPDAMRGRVSAINSLFVSSSNTLGDFESGAVAALLGAVPSAVIGGLGSLAIAAVWMLMFPSLRRVDRLQPVDRIKEA
jgi:MFS family permease